jgi:hypothetical protein
MLRADRLIDCLYSISQQSRVSTVEHGSLCEVPNLNNKNSNI